MIRKPLQHAAFVGLFLLATAGAASAANLLANPGFESGLAGWIPFGNVYAQTDLPPQFVPNSGTGLVSMFGGFSGGFNVGGMFQEFAAGPGSQWMMSSHARHWSGDALTGVGLPNDNWVVQKIAFFDAGNNEIGGIDSTILDGTFATDTWFAAAPIVGLAPAGTVKVQALILFLQPCNGGNCAGGAAHIDDVDFEDISVVPVEMSTWGQVKALYR